MRTRTSFPAASKPGRNQPCPCESGLKYKHCCIDRELRPQLLAATAHINGRVVPVQVNATNDWLNLLASQELPLKHFCADNSLYLFGYHTVGQEEELRDLLRQNQLTREHVLATFRTACRQEPILAMLTTACTESPYFSARQTVLTDAFEAHFAGKYTLSIPVLFTQLEGLLRDVGQLKHSDSVRGTIPNNIWAERLLQPIEDSARFFNAFIQKLFEGSKGPTADLNRNPVLHGFRVDYASHDDSMLLVLSILEIRLFLYWERTTGHALAQHPYLRPATPA